MTTTTITEFAVQVEMEPGHWTFVMDETGEKIATLETKAGAEEARKIWNLDRARVVSRRVRPTATPWRTA